MDLMNIDDNEVLARICLSVKQEKKHTLEVLEYLAEVNRRRLHLKEGYSSLHDFCIRHLKYSEGEANRRVHAARALWKFEEAVRPALEKEEITLSGLCLLSRHLTRENVVPLLNESKNQSTRKIEKVIAERFPETKNRSRTLVIELDEELEALLEKAKRLLSEKLPTLVLKKALKELTREKAQRNSKVKKHTRYVQTKTKQAIQKIDNHQCSYKSPHGVRCNQTAHLQIDHIRPFAKGGSSQDIENLRLLCRAHNLLAARRDFPRKRPEISRDMGFSKPGLTWRCPSNAP